MTRAERVLLVLLGFLVLFSPVFLGGVRGFEKDGGGEPTTLERFLWAEGPWWIQMALAGGIAAVSLAVAEGRRRAGEPPVWRLHPWIVLPFAGLVLLAVLQALPLPRGLLGVLSPQADRQLAFLLPGDDAWRPITLSPEGTLRALGGLALGGSVLLGTLLVARHRGAAAALLAAVVAAFAGCAAYGLGSTLLGDDTVLGFQKGVGKGVTGTFLNRSNFAAAAGLALPLALGLGWGARRARRGGAAALLFAASAVLAVAVPLSNSRMGLLSAAAGLVVLGFFAARAVEGPAWLRALIVLSGLLLAAGGVKTALDRLPGLRERFAQGRTATGFFDVRFPAWRSTLVLASRYPVLGVGTGAYEVAIHETQTAENPDELVHAHCEPLEVLAEGGVLGLALAVLLAAGAAAAVVRCTRSPDGAVRLLGCVCGAALAVLLVGSLAEFHLRVPALGIAAAVLAAVPAALLAGEVRAPSSAPTRKGRLALGCTVLALAGIALVPGPRRAALRGEVVRAEKAGNRMLVLLSALQATIQSPDAAANWRALALARAEGGRGSSALPAADAAVDLEPFNAYGHWARAVAILADEGPVEDAAAAIERARSRAGGIGHLLCAGGVVLLDISRSNPALREEALAMLREAGDCYPQFYSRACEAMDRLGLETDLKMEIVPAKWIPLEGLLKDARKRGDAASEKRLLRRLVESGSGDPEHRRRLRELGSGFPTSIGK